MNISRSQEAVAGFDHRRTGLHRSSGLVAGPRQSCRMSVAGRRLCRAFGPWQHAGDRKRRRNTTDRKQMPAILGERPTRLGVPPRGSLHGGVSPSRRRGLQAPPPVYIGSTMISAAPQARRTAEAAQRQHHDATATIKTAACPERRRRRRPRTGCGSDPAPSAIRAASRRRPDASRRASAWRSLRSCYWRRLHRGRRR